jgi:hypothetical protein
MDFIKRYPDHHFTADSSILHQCSISLEMALQQRRGYLLESTVRNELQRINLPRWFNDWRDDVICWFNVFIDYGKLNISFLNFLIFFCLINTPLYLRLH